MLARYVLADLWRNPRRTLSTMVGVSLGVGLFCGVLFFVDGLSASMTQRAVEPLAIDMQRVVTERAAGTLELTQTVDPPDTLAAGDEAEITIDVRNPGDVAAHEVTIRSLPSTGLRFVPDSARLDDGPIEGFDDNPLSSGPGQNGFNIGTLEPGASHRLTYRVRAETTTAVDDSMAATTYSSRESLNPTPANQPPPQQVDELARQIAELPGVANASALSIADLGPASLRASSVTAEGPAKIFGFDDEYARDDSTISITEGALAGDGAVLSAEAATALGISIGDITTVVLPDDTTLDLPVTGVADLSRSRSLFSSRRGGDLETFIYTPNAVIVSPATFADSVFPAYERAITAGAGRLKNPPIREVDIAVDRDALAAAPATALVETEHIASDVMSVAEGQDYLLDNISNTLGVAVGDAAAAKRLFVFLGVPGAVLAAMLAAYAGNVLAEAQRREHATLRIRGAGRRHLLRMLALRTALITGVGALVGLVAGFAAAGAILGRTSLERASTASLATSAVVGTLGGFVVTGFALYATGRRSIDREINEDRRRLDERAPLWRRARLDLVATGVLVVGTVLALRSGAFDGTPGSVYFGRSVELDLPLLVLPLAAWLAGSLLAARVLSALLSRARPTSTPHIGPPGPELFRRSVGRRPWAISNGAIVASLIVALATCLAAFTASYDAAKVDDARYANGADIRVTPSPTAEQVYGVQDAGTFAADGVDTPTPVIYGLSNVILRSNRTSDPANLAALDPAAFATTAPVDHQAARLLEEIDADPTAVLVSLEMADYLQVQEGDTIHVLLARATPDQVEIDAQVTGLFERLPGFPEGVDAVMSIETHTEQVPDKAPDFFLASVGGSDSQSLNSAVDALRQGPAAADGFQIDTRETLLDRDQSSLAALNIAGLVDLDSGFALAMATVAIAIFVFGLLLQRRREYVTLRAQGLESRTVRSLITAEAATVAVGGAAAGLLIGAAMGYYFVAVLRPLFVLAPDYTLPAATIARPVVLLLFATVLASLVGSRLVNALEPTELLRDE